MYTCVHEGRGKKEREQEIRENVNAWKIRYARESTSDYKELTKTSALRLERDIRYTIVTVRRETTIELTGITNKI